MNLKKEGGEHYEISKAGNPSGRVGSSFSPVDGEGTRDARRLVGHLEERAGVQSRRVDRNDSAGVFGVTGCSGAYRTLHQGELMICLTCDRPSPNWATRPASQV